MADTDKKTSCRPDSSKPAEQRKKKRQAEKELREHNEAGGLKGKSRESVPNRKCPYEYGVTVRYRSVPVFLLRTVFTGDAFRRKILRSVQCDKNIVIKAAKSA